MQAKNVKELSTEFIAKRIGKFREAIKKYTEMYNLDKDSVHVVFSKGNNKTGTLVPSVSLPPIISCGNCKFCKSLCYVVRNVGIFKGVIESYAKNYVVYKQDPKKYFDEISEFCELQAAFRWHVSGDIIDMEYFKGIIKVANKNPQTKFLIYTKMFDLVNEYLKKNKLPKNLQIIFSGWIGMEMNNPYNLPTSHPKFIDGRTTAITPSPYLCGGNCTKCFLHKTGCWNLKSGQEVIFEAH